MDFIISCALSDKQQLINVLSHHDVITEQLIMFRDVLVNIKQNKQNNKKRKKVRFKF